MRELIAGYRDTGPDVDAAGTEVFSALPAPTRAAVCRVLQEALTDAHRYGDGSAGATVVEVDADVELTVRNAVGPSAVAAASGGGRGLPGMRERVTDLGGSLRAGAEDGESVVRARVPRTVPAVPGTAERVA